MDNQSISQKILAKIKLDKVKPKPKWEFTLKNSILWLIFVVGIIVGSLAFSVVIFMATHTDWQYFASGPIKQLLIGLPYFWLIILILFLAIVFYDFKKTEKGYKYNPFIIILVSIIISIAIGSAVYAVGGGEKLEDVFYQKVPFYQKVVEHRGKFISAPEKGRLPGVILNVSQDSIMVKDFSGKIWNLATTTDEYKIGQRVLLFGLKIAENEFEVKIIKPWFKPHKPLLRFGDRNHKLNDLKENFK